VEQSPRQRRGQVAAGADAARGLAEQRDVVRVATERACVALHPAQRGELIGQPERAGALQARVAKEAEDTQPVVDGHDHGVSTGRQA
jgi:hypothetical protein